MLLIKIFGVLNKNNSEDEKMNFNNRTYML